ncbi:MAG: hypothetical protein ACI9SY_000459 [Candidatus Paceibacteria bacterium]|jgi:hypothetical protein
MTEITAFTPIWDNDVPPNHDNPNEYNLAVSINYYGHEITGIVIWVKEIDRYAFHIATVVDDTKWDLTELAVPEETYTSIRNHLRQKMSVYATRGLIIASEEEIQMQLAEDRYGPAASV